MPTSGFVDAIPGGLHARLCYAFLVYLLITSEGRNITPTYTPEAQNTIHIHALQALRRRHAVTLAEHVFFNEIFKIHEKYEKILRYVTYLLWSSLNILC